jgi:hypothetical protein
MDTFKCHIPNEAHYFIVKSPILKQLYSWKWFVRKTVLSVSQKHRNVKKSSASYFSHSEKILTWYFKLCHKRFLTQFAIRWSPSFYHLTVIAITYSDCVCVCSLSYRACNVHNPYFHLWPVWLYHIFPRYLIFSTIFGKKLLNIKCVFWFPLQLLFETFIILSKIQRDIITNVGRSHVNYPLFLSDFN